MNNIFSRIPYLIEKKMDAMIVTIIKDNGSSPRGSGSMMLVTENGPECGTVGGGAVEGEAIIHAKELIAESKCDVREYTLRKGSDHDIGMECGGDVTLYFQYVDHEDAGWLTLSEHVTAMIADRQQGWLSQHLSGELPELLTEENRASVDQKYTCILGTKPVLADDIYIMPLPIGERVIIFGGGHCALALAPVLHSVGFRIIVMDNRPEFADKERFPMADRVICGDFTKIDEYLEIQPEDYLVVMTNGHSNDFDVEVQILQKEFAYIGVIGSRKKTASVNARLLAAGIPEEAIAKVHTPIGLDIKAVTPEEIAISIVGEMILERANRRGSLVHGCPMK